MNDRDLINGLDACRPATDDLRQPELQSVADAVAADARAAEFRVRIERIDLATRRAIHNVSVPQGLEERLLARLRQATQLVDARQVADSEAQPVPGNSHNVGARHSRRRWLAWSAGLATAVAATVAAVFVFRPAPPLERQDLELGRNWHAQMVDSNDWQTTGSPDPARYPLPEALRLVPLRFRDASAIVGRDAVAFDLSLPGGPSATLFVIPQEEQARVAASPPIHPQSTTLGPNVAYWQRGHVIYVVVIASDRLQDYHRLIKAAPAVAV